MLHTSSTFWCKTKLFLFACIKTHLIRSSVVSLFSRPLTISYFFLRSHVSFEHLEDRQTFVQAICFMNAAQMYSQECRRQQVPCLEGWLYNLHRGNASELMVASYGQVNSGTLEPHSIRAVQLSMQCLDVAKRCCSAAIAASAATDSTTTTCPKSLPDSLFLTKVCARGMFVTSEFVEALGIVLQSATDFDAKQSKQNTTGFHRLKEVDIRNCVFTRGSQHGHVLTMPSLIEVLTLLHCTPGLVRNTFLM